jgi:hypothetical protein
VRRLWIDAQTFLEIEGVPDVWTWRFFSRLQERERLDGDPHVLETTVQGVKQSQKMTVESVVVNAKLDDTLFMAPNLKAK